ncbi:Uncharacterized protein APZ42_033379 [Daphnia magna]|uniref:Uncharacterized protein n=1 Tax=Daphnia magna TaxID=35525 RepID=A0A164L5K2_9CRUS|nr:Uncharacterized protein APZ42_033379 [Daphnia magna]
MLRRISAVIPLPRKNTDLLQNPVPYRILFHKYVKQIRIRFDTALFYRKFVWNCSVLQELVNVCFADPGQICYFSVIHNSDF